MATARFYVGNVNAPTPNKGMRLGVTALIRNGDALLFEYRSDSDLWSLIGGAVDMGDSLAGALVREIREETGLTVTGYQLSWSATRPVRSRSSRKVGRRQDDRRPFAFWRRLIAGGDCG